MRKRLWPIALLAFLIWPGAARAQFHAQWYFQDPTQRPQGVKQVYLTGLWNISVVGATNANLGLRTPYQTDTRGQLTVSNMVYGAYRVDVVTASRTNSFTNCFDSTISTNTLVIASSSTYICVGTNSTGSSDYAYTKAQIDAIIAGLPSGGGGSGNVVGPTTPAVAFTFPMFKSTSPTILTNKDNSGNTFGPTSFDASGSATAATNSISIASGVVARLSTNIFAAVPAGAVSGEFASFSAKSNMLQSSGFNSSSFDPSGAANTVATDATNDLASVVVFNNNGSANNLTASGTFSGSGIGLTIDASELSQGTVPLARFGVSASSAGHTNFIMFKSDGSYIGFDLATLLGLTGGGSGVTSVGLTVPSFMTASGTPVTSSGNLAFSLTAGASANWVGQNATNLANVVVTNGLVVGSSAGVIAIDATNVVQVSALGGARKFLITTNGDIYINGTAYFNGAPLLSASALGASQYVATDANTNLVSTQNGNNWTNTIPWTNEGTATNITATFNGTLQSFTITNGPTIFIHFAGGNGSCSYRITTNSAIVFDYNPKWLAGSNTMVTNGVLSLTSFGGTNAAQIEAAIKENQ